MEQAVRVIHGGGPNDGIVRAQELGTELYDRECTVHDPERQ